MKTSRHQDESGIALILTLTILAVVMILLMAFIVSMRTERMAARASTDLSKARALAEGAIDDAVAQLQSSTTTITPSTSYVTAPGVVYTWKGGNWTPTDLFTFGTSVNFSNSVLGNYGAGSSIQVGWQNVSSQGGVPQLVGRYAYWVDDESTKADLNTAKGNDPFGQTPAAIDLSQIFTGNPSDAGSITTYLNVHPPLDTIESIKLGVPEIPPGPPGPDVSPNDYSNSEYFITAKATSPDLTPWGAKRLNLTALLSGATTPPLKRAAVTAIAGALSTNALSTWDGTGKTFADKYNVLQIAANIVDYVTTDNTPTDSGNPADITAPTFLGLKQTPYLNELVISNTVTLAATATPGQGLITVTTTVTAELWYMYTNSPIGWHPPPACSVKVFNIPSIAISGGASLTFTPNGGTATFLANANIPPGTGSVTGSYVTAFTTLPTTTVSDPDTSQALTVSLSPGTINAIYASAVGRMDFAQIKLGLTNIRSTTLSLVNPTVTLVWQAKCNDPRVKPVSNTWQQIPNGTANTLGFANTGIDMTSGNGTIPGDGDISCHIISTPTRQRGTIYPSELAYIHTGIPWRTFFLEPQPSGESGMLPDWLAVDMFSATDITNVAGRMNINLQEGDSSAPVRVQPLAALLANNPSLIATVTNNIYQYQLVNTPTLTSFVPAADKYFTTAGQVCEVQGLVNTAGSIPKSTREAPAQAIVNLVTTRSDQFTIWAIGQSIKKVGAGKTFNPAAGDFITGEVKIKAVVERYEDPTTTPATVRYRTLYYRYIYD